MDEMKSLENEKKHYSLENNQLKNNNLKLTNEKYWNQYLTTITVSLAFITTGMTMTWSGPALPLLTNPETSPLDIQLTEDEITWLASISALGSLPGSIIAPILADNFGRKNTIVFQIVPYLVSYLLIYSVDNIFMLYAAQFLNGFNLGVTFVTVPVFISEISSPKRRGVLNVIAILFNTIGTLLIYIIVPLCFIKLSGIVCLLFAVTQTILIFFLKETPYYYIMKGNDSRACASLKYYRQASNVDSELKLLNQTWLEETRNRRSTLDVVSMKSNRKPLFIALATVIIQQASGTNVILSYSGLIFKETRANVSVVISGILLALANLLANVFSSFTVDRFGRKPLFIISSSGCTLATFAVGIYFYLKTAENTLLDNLSWLPLTGLILFVISYSFGLGPLPFLITTELFGTDSRSKATSLLSIFAGMLCFMIFKLFQIISSQLETSGAFWCFSLFSFCGVLFAIFLLPETKGVHLTQTVN